MTHENEAFEELPDELVATLKAADRQVSLIGSRVDREIAQQAAAHFAGRRSRARFGPPAWAAIAATVLVGLFLAQLDQPMLERATPVYGDIDGSGQVDIADVLQLARSRENDASAQGEIDAFAYRIVSLESGGESS